jgi:hypothetical protein
MITRLIYRFLLVGILSFGVRYAMAQNLRMIDSLRLVLSLSKDEVKFNLLNTIAWEHRFAYPDSTLIYAQKSYDYGVSIGLKKNLAIPLNYIGIAYNYMGNRLASLEAHQKAIGVAIEQSDSSSKTTGVPGC